MKTEDILFVIIFVVAIVLVLWFIFGQSPTLEQAMLAVILGMVIKNHGDIREVKGKFDEHLRTHK